MNSSPSPHIASLDTPHSAPADSEVTDLAPRSRRWDHILTAVTGVVLCPGALSLIGMAATAQAAGHLLRAALLLGALLLACATASLLFAARSSVGFLAAGLSALVLQTMIVLAPGHAAVLPSQTVQAVVTGGAALLLAGLWLGSSWGMRLARRGGHLQGRLAFRLTQADKEIGATPVAPPSRRRDHLLSFPWVFVCLLAAGLVMTRSYVTVITPGFRASWGAYIAVFFTLILLMVATTSTVSSSLGVRVVGPLLVAVSVPAFLGGDLPGAGLLDWLLPNSPGVVEVIAVGLVIMSAGWGAHTARRQGHAKALANLRNSPARLSGQAGQPGSHYGEHTQGGTREH